MKLNICFIHFTIFAEDVSPAKNSLIFFSFNNLGVFLKAILS